MANASGDLLNDKGCPKDDKLNTAMLPLQPLAPGFFQERLSGV